MSIIGPDLQNLSVDGMGHLGYQGFGMNRTLH